MVKLESELVARHGATERSRLVRGMEQVASFWRAADGDAAAFESFVRTHYAGSASDRDELFARFERVLGTVDGHMNEIGVALRWQTDIEAGALQPVDALFAGYEPRAHLVDDFFANKIAFVVLLNFPLTTLTERLGAGANWTRREWAEARLAQQFSRRIPAEVNLESARARSQAERYISGYNIWMHHLVNERGERLFPAKMRLLSHWNLRDEIRANHPNGAAGLAKQRMIVQVMERIVTQTIPAVVVDNPGVDWNPFTNAVKPAAVADSAGRVVSAGEPTAAPEPDTRYAMLLETFRAARLVDPYSPHAPTLIARRFDEMREIPEARVREMLEQVLTSPIVPDVAKLVSARLGRPLEPFDIWYNGFRMQGALGQDELDRIVSERYPTAAALEKDLPNVLGRLGFAPERAAYLASLIAVDPARGSGHAHGADLRGAKARLRTRVGPGGMDYKGFNIAIHELGHNVEQTFSLNDVDHLLLKGVPNTAFTEAIAFVFQARDLALLGVAPKPDPEAEAFATLDDFWSTYEISGVALLDTAIWHWMYEHPEAKPAELKQAVLALAKDIGNRYYAPVFGRRDSPLLAIYSHILGYQLYTPDYAIGSLIAAQIEEHLRTAAAIGPEVERMTRFGSVAPDLWMRNATGAPVGAEALLEATQRALGAVMAPRR
jgi:hypothetical protein